MQSDQSVRNEPKLKQYNLSDFDYLICYDNYYFSHQIGMYMLAETIIRYETETIIRYSYLTIQILFQVRFFICRTDNQPIMKLKKLLTNFC